MQPAGRPHSCHETRHRSGATAAQHVPARYGRIPRPLPRRSAVRRTAPGPCPPCPAEALGLSSAPSPSSAHPVIPSPSVHSVFLPSGTPTVPSFFLTAVLTASHTRTLIFSSFIHPPSPCPSIFSSTLLFFQPIFPPTHPPFPCASIHPSTPPTCPCIPLSIPATSQPLYLPNVPSISLFSHHLIHYLPFHPSIFHTFFPPSTHSPSSLLYFHPFTHFLLSFLLSIYPFIPHFHSGPLPKCRQTSSLPPAAPVTHPATHPPPLPLPLSHSSLPHSLSPLYPSPRDLLFLFKSFPGWVGNRISFFLDAFPGFAAAAGQARGSGRGLRGRCPRVGAGGSRSRLAPALPPPHPRPLFPPDPVGETLFKDGKSQAWGSLSPGVQKGKSTAAPSPGQAPLPSAGTERGPGALAFSPAQQPPETLSRPLPGTAHAGHGHRGTPVPAAASASGWEHPAAGSHGDSGQPRRSEAPVPWHQKGAGHSSPRALQRGETGS